MDVAYFSPVKGRSGIITSKVIFLNLKSYIRSVDGLAVSRHVSDV